MHKDCIDPDPEYGSVVDPDSAYGCVMDPAHGVRGNPEVDLMDTDSAYI